MIPLLPGYLSYATGLSGADLEHARRGRMLAGSILFVLGFSAVYVLLGWVSGSVGAWLVDWRQQLEVVLGILTILLGLAFAGLIPFSQREWRSHSVPAVGLAAAPLLGFLFGVGWTPCIGPTLAAITNLSLNEATAGRGALLAGVYCIGLGLPFIIAAIAYRRALGAFAFVRRHQQWVTRLGGADARPGRPRAGHRLVGPRRELAADPPGRELDGDACEHQRRAGRRARRRPAPGSPAATATTTGGPAS